MGAHDPFKSENKPQGDGTLPSGFSGTFLPVGHGVRKSYKTNAKNHDGKNGMMSLDQRRPKPI